MKPKYFFYYEDEPEMMGTDPREYTALLLRSYRAQKEMYDVERLGAGHYRISLMGVNAFFGGPVDTWVIKKED